MHVLPYERVCLPACHRKLAPFFLGAYPVHDSCAYVFDDMHDSSFKIHLLESAEAEVATCVLPAGVSWAYDLQRSSSTHTRSSTRSSFDLGRISSDLGRMSNDLGRASMSGSFVGSAPNNSFLRDRPLSSSSLGSSPKAHH